MATTEPAATSDGRDDAAAALESGLVAFLRFLADVPAGDLVAAGAAGGLLRAWAPDLVTVYLADDDGEALEIAANFGLTDDQLAVYARVPLDVDIPITRQFTYGYERFYRVADLAEEFPLLSAWAASHPHRATAEVVGLPLRSLGRTIGVVSVTFPHGVAQTWRLRVTLDALASALSLWAVAALASQAPTSERRRREALTLTPRQVQVLGFVRDGRTNPEIAADLGVSVSTVKLELSSLYRLLGARDRVDLVEKADRAGL